MATSPPNGCLRQNTLGHPSRFRVATHRLRRNRFGKAPGMSRPRLPDPSERPGANNRRPLRESRRSLRRRVHKSPNSACPPRPQLPSQQEIWAGILSVLEVNQIVAVIRPLRTDQLPFGLHQHHGLTRPISGLAQQARSLPIGNCRPEGDQVGPASIPSANVNRVLVERIRS